MDIRRFIHIFSFRWLTLKLIVVLLTTGLCLDSYANSLDLSQCTAPLGMEDFRISDASISSSSSYEHGNVGPHMGRVRNEIAGGAWCPKGQITSEAEEWLEIELHSLHIITATEVQGRFGNGQGQEFAEFYLISYWRPQLGKWIRYKDSTGNDILKGNINTYLASKTELNPTIIASKIRIIPYSYHRRTVCMRVEIYGCTFRGGLVSYSMPQGSKKSDNWNFYDSTYDGTWEWESNYLRNGLGQLTDGKVGPDNFKDDFYAPERGKSWVGWKNDSRNATDPLEIIFTFDAPREFSTVYIMSANQFTKEIQVFNEAKIFFSIGGKLYSRDPILYVSTEDCIFEDPKNISIKLHHRVAQYIKIQLFWVQWLLISEISFESSKPTMGNFTEESLHLNTSKEISSPQNDASLVVVETSPENIANSVVDQTPTVVEDFTSATIVMTAVISSFIAILLVLIMILAIFLMRHRLLTQEKIPSSSQQSMHYGEVGFNSLGGRQNDFGYTTPVVFFSSKEHKSNSPKAVPSSLSRDYDQPSFSSFVGSNANTTRSHGGSSPSLHSKMTEFYSCAPVINGFTGKPEFKTNDYEYVRSGTEFHVVPLPSLQKSPRKRLTTHSPLLDRPLHSRFRQLGLPEISGKNIKVLKKLGVFGAMYIGELQIPNNPMDRQLVAVKRLLRSASDKDKLNFLEEVRLLSCLNDPNVIQVLGFQEDSSSYNVVLEYLELGDLCQFLRGNSTLDVTYKKKLSFEDLIYIASQIASGLDYLQQRHIVHRDLAARNCVISRCLTTKVSHFATDTGLYSADYYRIDGSELPIRWMAWESVFMGKYSSKSDVWSFGVTLWEILNYGKRPYSKLNDQEVIHNLRRHSIFDVADPFETLDPVFDEKVSELICDTMRRNDEERPTFWEIRCFLVRKNGTYTNISRHHRSNTCIDQTPTHYV